MACASLCCPTARLKDEVTLQVKILTFKTKNLTVFLTKSLGFHVAFGVIVTVDGIGIIFGSNISASSNRHFLREEKVSAQDIPAILLLDSLQIPLSFTQSRPAFFHIL